METLPNEVKYIIFEKINDTRTILSLRATCKDFYSYFRDIPLFKDKKKQAKIVFNDDKIVWIALKDNKLIKEVVFKKYGEIKTILHRPFYFNNAISINCNLPKEIKISKQNHKVKKESIIEVRSQTVTTREISLVPPHCVIS